MEEKEISLDELTKEQLIGLKVYLMCILEHEEISVNVKYAVQSLLECVNQRIEAENIDENIKLTKEDIESATKYMHHVSSAIPNDILEDIQRDMMSNSKAKKVRPKSDINPLSVILLAPLGIGMVIGLLNLLWESGIIQKVLIALVCGGGAVGVISLAKKYKLIEKIKNFIKEKSKEKSEENSKKEEKTKVKTNIKTKDINRIKKIKMYSYDKETCYLIVYYDNSDIKIINNFEEIRKIIDIAYNMYKINDLDASYKEKIEILKEQEIIICEEKDIIKKITRLTNKQEDIGLIVERISGKLEKISSKEIGYLDFYDKYNSCLKELNNTYEASDKFLIENGILESKNTEKKRAKIKRIRLFKRGIAIFLTTGVALVGGYTLGKKGIKNNQEYVLDTTSTLSRDYNDEGNTPIITEEPTPIPTQVITKSPTITPTTIPTPTVEPYIPITEKNTFLVKLIHDSGMEETTYMEVSYNDICFYASNSANEIMNYILNPEANGKPSIGVCVAYSYSIDDPKEKVYVSYIENIRNALVASYFAGDMSEYNKYSRRGCVVIMAGLGDDKLISKDGYTVCYSDLSPETKDVTTKIFKDILDMSQNTTFEYDGKTYGFYDAQDIVYSRIDELEDVKIK